MSGSRRGTWGEFPARALVTGAAGFIGSHLTRCLLAGGTQVVGVDNLSTGRRSRVAGLQGLRFVELDVNRDGARLAELFEEFRPQLVFHYAAFVGVLRTQQRPLDVMRDLQGLQHIAAAAARVGDLKLIYASSSEVYGASARMPMDESDSVAPEHSYAVVKLAGEHLFSAHTLAGNFRACSLRHFNVYGPWQSAGPYGFVVGTFCQQVLSGCPPTVFGDGSQTRDFTFIDDAVRLSMAAGLSDETDGLVLNIGTGGETSILQLARSILEAAGRTDLQPDFLPPRPGEILKRCASVRRMRRYLGEPVAEQAVGLVKTLEYYRAADGTLSPGGPLL